MPYQKWFSKTIKKTPTNQSELSKYIKVLLLGLLIFAVFYYYLTWLEIPGMLNKAIADTSVILMGLSMLLTSVCYFWNFADTTIIYRKHLGLVGFGFAMIHLVLSNKTLLQLTNETSWQTGAVKPVIAGLVATIIFAIMALISNKIATTKLGGVGWGRILRTGYIALFFVLLHVVYLKGARWIPWFQTGIDRPPSLSLLITIFIIIVLLSRILLWLSLLTKSKQNK
jgi:DMSO/TMAO reductase YedYZ heme-binding membrane subunit